jgi:hypothetical protein
MSIEDDKAIAVVLSNKILRVVTLGRQEAFRCALNLLKEVSLLCECVGHYGLQHQRDLVGASLSLADAMLSNEANDIWRTPFLGAAGALHQFAFCAPISSSADFICMECAKLAMATPSSHPAL